MFSFNIELVKATIRIVIELLQCCVEIIGNLGLAGDIGVGEGWVGIAESSSNWLINKDYIVFFGP